MMPYSSGVKKTFSVAVSLRVERRSKFTAALFGTAIKLLN
jgi:hypothetical protein